MRIIHTIAELRSALAGQTRTAFVPTLGTPSTLATRRRRRI